MSARLAFAFISLAIIVACGGPGPAPSTLPPGQTAAPTSTSTIANGGGETLDSSGIAASLAALQALDSWTFTGRYWTKVLDEATEQSVSGTERRKPVAAVDAAHPQPDGTSFRYIRIGDDIWANLGTDQFYHYDAAGSDNLISQYEPFYIATLAADAAGRNEEYDLVGEENVNGVGSLHFTLSAHDREQMAELTGLQPDQWAGDVWIAKVGGYIVRFAWGPQTVATAQPIMGFLYDTTSTNCACPIEGPTNVANP